MIEDQKYRGYSKKNRIRHPSHAELSSYYDGEIRSEKRNTWIHDHLTECPRCQSYIRQFQQLSGCFISVTESERRSMLQVLDVRQEPSSKRTDASDPPIHNSPRRYWISRISAIAAVIAFILGIGWLVTISKWDKLNDYESSASEIVEVNGMMTWMLSLAVPAEQAIYLSLLYNK